MFSKKKNLENENFIAAALHAQIGLGRSDQSQSNTLGQPTNGGPVLKYFLSETIHAQENGSRGPHFAKSLNSNFLKGLTYSALIDNVCVSIFVPGVSAHRVNARR